MFGGRQCGIENMRIMIWKEGGCIDEQHGSVWVRLTYNDKKQDTIVEIRDRKDGKRLALNGLTGPGAKRYYDRLNLYFFGDDRKTDSGN